MLRDYSRIRCQRGVYGCCTLSTQPVPDVIRYWMAGRQTLLFTSIKHKLYQDAIDLHLVQPYTIAEMSDVLRMPSEDFNDLPPFPKDVLTAPLLRVSLSATSRPRS